MKFNCVVFAGTVRLNEGTKVVVNSNDVSLFELSLHVRDTSYLYVPSFRSVHTTDELVRTGALGLVTTPVVAVAVAVAVEVAVEVVVAVALAMAVLVAVGFCVAAEVGVTTSFKLAVSPLMVAYCPHNQQVFPFCPGISMIQ